MCAESFASFKAVAPVESDTDWSKVVAPFRRASKKEGFRDYLARWLTYWRENDGLAETIRPSFWLNEGRYEDDTPDEHAGRSARGPSRRSNPYDELADLFDSSAADRPPLGLPATDRWPIGLPASD